MKRLVWLSDLHLNFVTAERLARLARDIRPSRPDAILVGGDTGEAPSFAGYLERLAGTVNAPVYFVLGNHDYYRGAISEVREKARMLSRGQTQLHWLPDAGVVPISKNTVLIGHGGWGDARAGRFLGSGVILNDYLLIEELRDAHGAEVPLPEAVLTVGLQRKLHELGDQAAAHFQNLLPEALQAGSHVIVLTHVPPFRAACRHEGRVSDDHWAPHFVCQAVGEVLAESMRRHPDKRMTVLCGHTHSPAETSILENLQVLTGKAEYGSPEIQPLLEVEED